MSSDPRTVWRPHLLALVLLATMVLPTADPVSATTAPAVTIDSHRDGDLLPVGSVRLSGSYTDAYDLSLVWDGQRTHRVHTRDPDGDGSGTWHYDLDTTGVDGEFEIAVNGKRTDNRYSVWSPFVRLRVDNRAANIPAVAVVSPDDGAAVRGPTSVRVSVEAHTEVREVSVRVNGGPWRRARDEDGTYTLSWDPRELGDTMAGIEARAVDAHGNTGHSPTVYVRAGNGGPETVRTRPQDRALWIWEKASYNLVLNEGSRRLLHTVATDTDTFDSRPVTTLYLGVDRFAGLDMLVDRRPRVREFLRWAHAEGFSVHATMAGGTRPPFMGGLERYHPRAVAELEKILDYNLSSAPDERFDGVNVDIEPYLHTDFRQKRPQLQRQWLDILAKLIERRDIAGSGMVLGPAIPRWLDTSDCCRDITWEGATKPLIEHIQDMTDYVSIMDYRDTADGGAGIIEQARAELDYAEAIGKPNSVVLGVETLDIASSGDPETITFREEGRAVAERELRKVYAEFGDHPAFGGVALHHYDSLRALPSVWGPNAVYPPTPPDAEVPTAPRGRLVARTFDHRSIDLSYGRAFDDTEVEHYRVYRSTAEDLTPGPDTLAGTSRGLSFTDTGLLPETTYHYRVAAVDAQGKEGPASASTSATTSATDLKPLIIDELAVTGGPAGADVELRVIDRATGAPVVATVHGRFTRMAGRFLTMTTDADGRASGSSETLGFRTGQAGFEPLRIRAAGYYWASAADRDRHALATWEHRAPVTTDTFVRSGTYADTNYGQAAELEIADAPDADTPNEDRLAYLKADLDALADEGTVSATLHLHVSSPGSTLVVRALADDSWSEDTVTWAERPSGEGGNVLATVAADEPGWHSVDVTTAVNAHAADGALTLRLSTATTGGTLVTVDSAEGAAPPYLIVY